MSHRHLNVLTATTISSLPITLVAIVGRFRDEEIREDNQAYVSLRKNNENSHVKPSFKTHLSLKKNDTQPTTDRMSGYPIASTGQKLQ